MTLGDLNNKGFEPAVTILEQGGLPTDTVNRLPLSQRYDYAFDGDSETLSGLLVSPALNQLVAWAGPVHISADFADARTGRRSSASSARHRPGSSTSRAGHQLASSRIARTRRWRHVRPP